MFLKSGLAAVAAAALMLVPHAAQAQDKKVRLQVAGAFPSTTGLLGPTQQYFVDTVKKISGGSIDARFFEPGALVPASQYFDAICQRLARCGLDGERLLHRQGHRFRHVRRPCRSGRKPASTWAG